MLQFFAENAVRDAIERLAEARRVTVVAGAGASMEIGLPSWEGLVLDLLGDVVTARQWDDDGDRFRAAAREGGLLAGAQLVESVLGAGEMAAAIKRHLYGDADPAGLRPGPLARAVAGLQAQFGRRLQIATTNYDEVLELALRERLAAERWWTNVRSQVRPGPLRPDTVAVTHLHGLLGRRDLGKVILSEGDYQRMQLHRSWQEEWMVDALSSTSCLFVGASMTDANLIRYLYGAGGSRLPHVAVFRRRRAVTAAELRFRARIEEVERARWHTLGVTPLFADDFADIAQFVNEVAYRRGDRAAYVALPDRLRAWFDQERESGSLYCAEDDGYREVQDLLHDGLVRLAADARALLARRGVQVEGERLAVALLALQLRPSSGQAVPSSGQEVPSGQENVPSGQENVVVLASSDRIMTAVDSIAPFALSDRSEWTGVRAISLGVPVGEKKDVYSSRWRYVTGFPVYREAPRLPLGAVTLSSMSAESALTLERLPAEVRAELHDLLVRSAISLLTIGS